MTPAPMKTKVECSELFDALGYPGYDIAQRALEAEGWVYLIQYDAWFHPLDPVRVILNAEQETV